MKKLQRARPQKPGRLIAVIAVGMWVVPAVVDAVASLQMKFRSIDDLGNRPVQHIDQLFAFMVEGFAAKAGCDMDDELRQFISRHLDPQLFILKV